MADRRLQVFHAVARHLSFTRAADALFMTQPAVTFQVRQLEEQYNTRLFERRHGSISLTPAGELVLAYAERILGLSDEMDARIADMTGEVRGRLSLGASAAIAEILLPGMLTDFNASYPQVRVQLSVANSGTIATRVADHALDLGLTEAPSQLPGLSCDACREDEMVVICAPGYPLAGVKKVGPRLLLDYEYVSRESGSGTRDVVAAYFGANGVALETLKTQMELGSPEALKAVVATGLGFAIIARASAEREVQAGTLRAIPLKPPLRRSIYLVQPADRFRSQLVSTFVQFIRKQMKDMAT